MNKNIITFIEKNVDRHAHDIVVFVAKKFGVTRKTAHKYVRRLVDEGALVKVGHTRGVKYYRLSPLEHRFSVSLQKANEDDLWQKELKMRCKKLDTAVYNRCQFVFTELVNNAIDHSQGTKLDCTFSFQSSALVFIIHDNGIGIFQKLIQAFGYSDEREAILHLHKGKLTSDPDRHTGQGIFFSARTCALFTMKSGSFLYQYDAIEDDWTVQSDRKKIKGTYIRCEIDTKNVEPLRTVFDKFSHPESLSFDRSQVTVQLSVTGEEVFISRTQARKLLVNLDQFSFITLDFKGVQTVGQGFVDQVFRVWQNEHSNITIDYINANDDVEFMIKRGLSDSLS